MLIFILFVIIVAVAYGPQLWIRYVFAKYSRNLDEIPGNGHQLAVHLLKVFEFEEVKVERTKPGNDHYSPDDNVVRLSPAVHDGNSLTAIAVAAHEVGHALQFNRQEPVSRLRKRYLVTAHNIQRVGSALLMASPVALAIFRVPHAMLFTGGIGVATMLAAVAMNMAVLPEEWDASFNKALPILAEGNYVTPAQMPKVKTILQAAALTYVAKALADILSLWRWLAILRR